MWLISVVLANEYEIIVFKWKKIKALSVQIGDIIYFEVPKEGGAIIGGGVTIRGNTVHAIYYTFNKTQLCMVNP